MTSKENLSKISEHNSDSNSSKGDNIEGGGQENEEERPQNFNLDDTETESSYSDSEE